LFFAAERVAANLAAVRFVHEGYGPVEFAGCLDHEALL
jgi:hypothetical protein